MIHKAFVLMAKLGLSVAIDNTRMCPLRPQYFVPGIPPVLPAGRRWSVYHNTKPDLRLAPRDRI